MTERVGGTPVVSLSAHLRPYLSGDILGLYRCPSPPSSPAALSGDILGLYRCPSPPPVPLRRCFWPLSLPVTSGVHLRRRFWPFPLPVTSAHPSPATFLAVSVACHLRPSLSGDISEHFRRPPPPLYISGDVPGHFRCPSPRPYLSGDVSGRNHRYIHFLCHAARLFTRVGPLICN